MEDKRANIINVLSSTEVIINKGLNDGIKKGTKFKIIAKEIELIDIDGTFLGKYIYPKGEIFAKEVYEKYTYCHTGNITEWEEEEIPNFGQAVASAFEQFGKAKNRYKKVKTTTPIELNVNTANIIEDFVDIGDEVIVVK